MPWPKMPFPTRMTVIRLEGGLVVHSPTALTADLEAEIELLGPPRWIVGPNRIHYWWIPEWREGFPNEEAWLAPRNREQAGRRIALETPTLLGTQSYPWEGRRVHPPTPSDHNTHGDRFNPHRRTMYTP